MKHLLILFILFASIVCSSQVRFVTLPFQPMDTLYEKKQADYWKYGALASLNFPDIAYIVLAWESEDVGFFGDTRNSYIHVSEGYIDYTVDDGSTMKDGDMLIWRRKSYYHAILFFDRNTLDDFIKTRSISGYTIIDVKKGTQKTMR